MWLLERQCLVAASRWVEYCPSARTLDAHIMREMLINYGINSNQQPFPASRHSMSGVNSAIPSV